MRYLGILVLFISCTRPEPQLSLPNILWITSEDNSPFLGCYGDTYATTPHLDSLAARGFLYTHAYANAPVCAPSRNTILTGVYANSAGQENMRSQYPRADQILPYPVYLKQLGYYCTNSQKEDFNIKPEQTKDLWDELGKDAHYKNRPAGRPFFAIFNSTLTHESSLHKTTPDSLLRHRPEEVRLPPYHPDTPDLRHDWAQFYDKIEEMDQWVGGILQELRESGEADNTIIFYYGDHGGVLARSKRYVYESGTRVPLIVYIPEKYKHLYPTDRPGSKIDRMVGFVDLVPTLLSITETPIPAYIQGNAFLGKQKTEDPAYVYMFRARMDERYDLSRAVRDKKYRYIRNYMPHRIYAQPIEYLFRAPSIRSWENACKAGNCNEIQNLFWNTKPHEELYDTENDPWEVHNLAENPQYQDVLERMRRAHREWTFQILDAGFIPEAELAQRTKEQSAYELMRSGKIDLERLFNAAEAASSKDFNAEILLDFLNDPEPSVRYWGANGLLLAQEKARPYLDVIKKAAQDPAESVKIIAAETLYRMGETTLARKALLEVLQSDNPYARTQAMNVIDYVNDQSNEIKNSVLAIGKKADTFKGSDYDLRMVRFLLDKWKIDPNKNGINLNW